MATSCFLSAGGTVVAYNFSTILGDGCGAGNLIPSYMGFIKCNICTSGFSPGSKKIDLFQVSALQVF
jgi:hypothetical protein